MEYSLSKGMLQQMLQLGDKYVVKAEECYSRNRIDGAFYYYHRSMEVYANARDKWTDTESRTIIDRTSAPLNQKIQEVAEKYEEVYEEELKRSFIVSGLFMLKLMEMEFNAGLRTEGLRLLKEAKRLQLLGDEQRMEHSFFKATYAYHKAVFTYNRARHCVRYWDDISGYVRTCLQQLDGISKTIDVRYDEGKKWDMSDTLDKEMMVRIWLEHHYA